MTSKYKAKSRPVSNTKLRSISYCTKQKSSFKVEYNEYITHL